MKVFYGEYKFRKYTLQLSQDFENLKKHIVSQIAELKGKNFEIAFIEQKHYEILNERNYLVFYNNYKKYKVIINELKDAKITNSFQNKVMKEFKKINEINSPFFQSQKQYNNNFINTKEKNNDIVLTYQKENKELNEKINNLEKENQELNENINNLEKENQELNEKINNLEKENQENKELKEKINNLEKENQELKKNLETINDQFQIKIKNSNLEKNKEIIRLNNLIDDLNEKLKMKKKEDNKNNIEIIKKNKDDINELYKENLQLMSNQLKGFCENQFQKFQQSILNKSLEINKSFLNNQKEQFYKITEENNRIYEYDKIQTLEDKIQKENKLVHKGYQCNICNQNPLLGIRYECENCCDYNLCEKCYYDVLNERKKHFNHKLFIKIDKVIEKYNNRINDHSLPKKKNEEEENENIEFSYKIKSHYIEKTIQAHTSETSVLITLTNNCKYQYKTDTKLICDEKSNLKCKPCNIQPLNTNQSQNCLILFENLKELKSGEYYIFLNFMVGNIIYGDQIIIKLIIGFDKKFELLKQFRNEYQLSNKDYSNETLLFHLEKNNFNFSLTFNSLFD